MASGTRQKQQHRILRTPVVEDDKTLKQNVLPTKSDILKCRLANTTFGGLSIRNATKQVIKQIQTIYALAAIPTLTARRIEYKITKYYEDFRELQKYSDKFGKPNEALLRKIENFRDDGDKLMEFAGDLTNCLPEDLIFLENMRTTRNMFMGNLDPKAKREAKRTSEIELRIEQAELNRQQRIIASNEEKAKREAKRASERELRKEQAELNRQQRIIGSNE